MRTLFAILVLALLVGFTNFNNDSNPSIRYDGYYKSQQLSDSLGNDRCYFRFYPTGEVVTVCIIGDPYNIEETLNLSLPDPVSGKYQIDGDSIFLVCSFSEGSIEYKGRIIDQNKFTLQSHSLITNKGRDYIYTFVEKDMEAYKRAEGGTKKPKK